MSGVWGLTMPSVNNPTLLRRSSRLEIAVCVTNSRFYRYQHFRPTHNATSCEKVHFTCFWRKGILLQWSDEKKKQNTGTISSFLRSSRVQQETGVPTRPEKKPWKFLTKVVKNRPGNLLVYPGNIVRFWSKTLWEPWRQPFHPLIFRRNRCAGLISWLSDVKNSWVFESEREKKSWKFPVSGNGTADSSWMLGVLDTATCADACMPTIMNLIGERCQPANKPTELQMVLLRVFYS